MTRACLSPEQRQEIRDLRALNPTLRYKVIAEIYHCSEAHVGAIIGGRTGKCAEPQPVKLAPPAAPNKYTSFTPDPAKLRAGR